MTLKTPILIFCRIKPNIVSENFHSEFQEYTVNPGQGSDNDNLIIYNYQNVNFVNHKPDSYSFQFVKVFNQEARQDCIYNAVAKPVVESALKGYNGTIFAYGQTGSGKTHTISGDRDNPGIVPRALNDIFTAIRNAEGETFDVQMSYLEIYNEQSNDLLLSAGEEKKKISLREGGHKVLEWHNLSMTPVETFSEALELLTTGDNNRIVGDTPMNIYSSRSHTILTIHLTAHVHGSLEIRRAKLNLVDLAGSERVHKTGEEGIVLEEARHINLSLHYLEQVIVALSDSGRSHVPYRNCTLTAALRDSLGGNCMTVMVANITMDKANIEETISTCRFAQRVALVRNELTVNTERDLSGENSQLKTEIQQLRGQCSSLRAKVKELERMTSQERKLARNSDFVGKAHMTEDDLNPHQLKTDIIYMIDWLQELKCKQSSILAANNDSVISSFSVLSSVEPDEGFDEFVASVKAKEEWLRARETERAAADALNTQLSTIDTVHHEILNWWKHNEKSLVREMLCGRVINVPGGEVATTAASEADDSTSGGELSINLLLQKHSELLKDFQLLKSRLQSSKRNLQRLKRKYLVEFNNWKKGKVSFDDIFEEMKGFGDAMEVENKKNDIVENDSMKNEIAVEFNEDKKGDKSEKDQDFDYKTSNYPIRFNWNYEEFRGDNSLMLNESDFSSVFNNSAFSTSSLLSDSRVTVASEPRGCKEPRLVRSVPTALHSTATFELGLHRNSPSLRLTGDQEIDEEIIAFYQSKRNS